MVKAQSEKQLSLLSGFAAELIEQFTTDDIIWLIIDRIISALDFEDCVIYLLPTGSDVLVQRAAFGDKQLPDRTIKDPIQIPLGEGIVGTAALQQKTIRVKDASLDRRYILDDMARASELAVPIVFENRTLGVIDSENVKPDFFSESDETFLSTIANMTAARLAEVLRREQVDQTEANLRAVIFKRPSDDGSQGLSEVSVSSRLSHDLKSPLNAIRGMTQLLIEESSDENLRKPLSIVQRAAGDLSATVDNLLGWLSPSTETPPNGESGIQVRNFIFDIVDRLTAHQATTIECSIDDVPNYLDFRATAYEQILRQLITHGLSFGTDSPAALSVQLIELDREFGLLFGLNLRADQRTVLRLSQVFEVDNDPDRFNSSANADIQGLLNAKALAERIGGNLTLAVDTSDALSFQLTLPVRSPMR